MTHGIGMTPYISKALVDLAIANKLKYLHDDQYEDLRHNRLTQTELGYISTEYFNYKLRYDELKDYLEELESKVKSLEAEKRRLVTQNKELSGKTNLKIEQILNDHISDREKVIQIKKYLNV